MSTTTETSPQKSLAPTKNLRSLLEEPAYKKRLSELLRDRAPQFCAALVQVVGRSKQLQGCNPDSVIGAAITAAALDLSLDPNLGEAHLVPYGNQCQFQIGYKGFTQLGLRSGQYKRLGWKVIHKGELDTWNELTGELTLNEDYESDEVIGYAAYFALTNGFERFSYWPKEKVQKHAERYSQAYKAKKMDSPWFTSFDVMGLKTVLKDLINHWGPKSSVMQKALAADQQVFVDADTGLYADNPDNSKPDTTIRKPIFSSDPKQADATVIPAKAVIPTDAVSKPAEAVWAIVKAAGANFEDLQLHCGMHPRFKDTAGMWTSFDDISADDMIWLEKNLAGDKEGLRWKK